MKWLFLLFGAISAFADTPCPATLPADVCALEIQLYRHTDFHKTTETRAIFVAIKNLLASHFADSAVLRQHLLGLFDHALEEAHRVRAPRFLSEGARGDAWLLSLSQQLRRFENKEGPVIPLDWELPTGVKALTFVVEKFYEPSRDRTEYGFGLFGALTAAGTVEKLQVLRYPSTVIADKSEISTWHEASLPPGKSPIFSLTGSTHETPQEEGLYLWQMKLRGSEPASGWFILSRTTPTALPVVQTPALNETFFWHGPVFHWLDFHSPQYRSFEQRKLRIAIQSLDSREPVVWRSGERTPRVTNDLIVGPDTPGVNTLQAGAYEFQLAYEERWLAGSSLFIGRTSRVAVPFRVSAKKVAR